ncbi:MAG: lysylphosphatidylglycerol synthase transmembrane domain-containing protein [Candidatus Micrarchaeia archaeon]
MLKKLLALLGIALFLAIIYFAGPDKLVVSLASANPFLLFAAFAAIVAITVINGARFHILARSLGRLSFSNTFAALCLSQLVNQGMTAALGEVSKGALFKKLHGISFSRTIGIVFVERGQDFILALIIALLFLSSSNIPWLSQVSLLLLPIIALIAVVLFAPSKWFNRFKRFEAVYRLARGFKQGVRGLSRKVLFLSLVLTLLSLVFNGLANQLLLSAMGAPVPLATVLAFTSAALIAGFLSGLPGGLGSREVVLVALFSSLGVSAAVVIAASVLLRGFFAGINLVFYLLFSRKGGQVNL